MGPGGRGGLGEGEEILQAVSGGQASSHKGMEAPKSLLMGGFETLVKICTRHLCGRLERRVLSSCLRLQPQERGRAQAW